MEITFFPDRGSNTVRWTQSPTLYHVAIKAGLYLKAVQVYHILILGDILKLSPPKNENFQIKTDIFHISAQNIDCGYSLETLR